MGGLTRTEGGDFGEEFAELTEALEQHARPAEVKDVPESLATLSDQLVLAAILLYLAGMIGYALELAFGRVTETVAERKLVAVGGSP